MERLYKMSREELLKFLDNWGDRPELFDPFTDQQIRDYITDQSVRWCLSEFSD